MVYVGIVAAVLFGAAALIFDPTTGNPEIARWTVLYAITAGAFGVGIYRLWKYGSISYTKSNIVALAFLAWAAFSLLWSADPHQGAVELRYLLALVAVYFGVQALPQNITKSFPSLAGFVTVGAIVLYGLFPASSAGFGNPNFLAEFILIALPILALGGSDGIKKLKISPLLYAAVFVAGCYMVLAELNTKVGWFTLMAFSFLGVYWLVRNKQIYWAGVAVLGMAVAAMWIDVYGDLQSSIGVRLALIYDGTLAWLESPVWGHGVGSFGWIFPKYQEAHLAVMGANPLTSPAMVAGYAHNQVIQTGIELGAVGVVLLGMFTYFLVTEIRRDSTQKALIASLFIVGALSMIEFPLHNPHTGAFAAILAGLAAKHARTRTLFELPRVAAPVAVLPALLIVAGLGWSGWNHYLAERDFAVTRTFLSKDAHAGFRANLSAYHRFPYETAYRRQLALSIRALMQQSPNVEVEHRAADKLYQVAHTSSPHWPASKIARVQYLVISDRWGDNLDEIERIMTDLKTQNGHKAAVWIIEGWVAAVTGNPGRLFRAIHTGLQTPYLTEAHVAEFETLAKMLPKE